MKYARYVSPGSVCSKCWTCSKTTTVESRRSRVPNERLNNGPCSKIPKRINDSPTYNRIKSGLKRSNPAAIVLWAFHNLPSQKGLTSRRVIGFLKKHYRVMDNPRNTGKSIGTMIRCAVDFGLLKKRGNKFFLATKTRL